MGEKKQAIVELAFPFALERRGHAEREHIVGWDSQRATEYLRALRAEIAANAGEFDDCEVVGVRLGGGIATNAPAEELWATGRSLREALHVAPGTPMSCRASICNISGASMPYLRRAGVTRFDFELLALDNADFCRLNHTDALQDFGYVVDDFLHAYANKSLGVVLAYGFDAPDTRAFRRSVVQFTRMPATHLILERWFGPGVASASQDLQTAQLREAREVLTQAGFCEYAPLRFARPGDEDPVWALPQRGEDLARLGFGLGAVTEFDGVRSVNTSDWDAYIQASGDFTKITERVEPLSSENAER